MRLFMLFCFYHIVGHRSRYSKLPRAGTCCWTARVKESWIYKACQDSPWHDSRWMFESGLWWKCIFGFMNIRLNSSLRRILNDVQHNSWNGFPNVNPTWRVWSSKGHCNDWSSNLLCKFWTDWHLSHTSRFWETKQDSSRPRVSPSPIHFSDGSHTSPSQSLSVYRYP